MHCCAWGVFPWATRATSLNKGLAHRRWRRLAGLIDMLEKKRFTFNNCKYLCMDEADRMIDLGFEDDVRNIMSFFKVILVALHIASAYFI
jgi:hypothetical protein